MPFSNVYVPAEGDRPFGRLRKRQAGQVAEIGVVELLELGVDVAERRKRRELIRHLEVRLDLEAVGMRGRRVGDQVGERVERIRPHLDLLVGEIGVEDIGVQRQAIVEETALVEQFVGRGLFRLEGVGDGIHAIEARAAGAEALRESHADRLEFGDVLGKAELGDEIDLVDAGCKVRKDVGRAAKRLRTLRSIPSNPALV